MKVHLSQHHLLKRVLLPLTGLFFGVSVRVSFWAIWLMDSLRTTTISRLLKLCKNSWIWVVSVHWLPLFQCCLLWVFWLSQYTWGFGFAIFWITCWCFNWKCTASIGWVRHLKSILTLLHIQGISLYIGNYWGIWSIFSYPYLFLFVLSTPFSMHVAGIESKGS
jgi:hypothetical protein